MPPCNIETSFLWLGIFVMLDVKVYLPPYYSLSNLQILDKWLALDPGIPKIWCISLALELPWCWLAKTSDLSHRHSHCVYVHDTHSWQLYTAKITAHHWIVAELISAILVFSLKYPNRCLWSVYNLNGWSYTYWLNFLTPKSKAAASCRFGSIFFFSWSKCLWHKSNGSLQSIFHEKG